MAKGYLFMIMDRIKTWEERAIEQSCVERVAWPDLFHVTIRCLTVIDKVLSGLVVYPDNMLLEIIESCGCFASNAAKEFLKTRAAGAGISVEEAYRIVQIASFNAQEPSETTRSVRDDMNSSPSSWEKAKAGIRELRETDWRKTKSIQTIIEEAQLKPSDQLEASEGDVGRWNAALTTIFIPSDVHDEWAQLFDIEVLLRDEGTLFDKVLGDAD